MSLCKKLINCPTRVHDELHKDTTPQTITMTQWTHAYVPCLCDVCLLLSEVSSVYSEQTLVASWANAAKPSPNRHYVPVCEQKKWIPIYLQANRLINLRGLCVLPDREALWENHHLSRVRCGFHCDVIEPVLLIARAYDFIQQNKVPYVLWAKEEHQPASCTYFQWNPKRNAFI